MLGQQPFRAARPRRPEPTARRDAFADRANPCGRTLQIAAGGDNTCVILKTGSVECWGDNYYGELGIDSLESTGSTPTSNAVDLGAGASSTAAAIAVGENDVSRAPELWLRAMLGRQ